jgi:hypothetical protein
MKKIVAILLLILLTACKQDAKLVNPNGVWSDLELEELNYIVSEFDAILTTKYKTSSEKDAYIQFSKQNYKELAIPYYNEFGKLGDTLMQLQVFNKIWEKHQKSELNPNPDPEKFRLSLKSDYFKYLYTVGDKYKDVKEYAENIEVAEFISAPIVAGVSKNVDVFDLEDKNSRLIIAIHYLTLINEYFRETPMSRPDF